MFQTALYSATEFAYRADCLLLDHTRRAGTPRIPRVPGARLNPQSPVGRDPTALQEWDSIREKRQEVIRQFLIENEN